LKVTQRYMVKGLEHEFLFDQEYVEDVACTGEVDRAIIVRYACYQKALKDCNMYELEIGISIAK